jgi:hypothetical protein
VTVTFSEPVLGVSRRSLEIVGVHARVEFKPGSRTATLVPSRAVSPGRHRLRVTGAITDLTLNRLHPLSVSYRVR